MSFVLYKSQNMVDTPTTNGGYMSSIVSVDSVGNNIFPNVSDSQRNAGLTSLRKLFWKNEQAQNAPSTNTRVFLDTPTSGNDWITMFPGTQSNVQNDLTGNEQQYGIAKLNNDLQPGSTTFAATAETSLVTMFTDQGTIRISNGESEEFFTNVTVVKANAVYTFTLNTGDLVLNNYTSANTYISSVIEAGTVEVLADTFTANTVLGTYSNTYTPILLNSYGCIYQQWTITFINATSFTCSGNILGGVGSTGNVTTSYTVTNTAMNAPYFTIPANFFTGTWAAGQWLRFYTRPASFPIWFKRVVPIGTSSCADAFTHGITGEIVPQN